MNKPLPVLMKPVIAFAAIDVSKSKGYDMIARGLISTVRIGTLLRVPRS